MWQSVPKMKKQVSNHQILTPDIESQAGLNLWYGYLNITGCTGAPERNAPLLNGRRKLPFVVVPSTRKKKQIKTIRSRFLQENLINELKALA